MLTEACETCNMYMYMIVLPSRLFEEMQYEHSIKVELLYLFCFYVDTPLEFILKKDDIEKK